MDMTRLCDSCGNWFHYKLAACDACGTVDPELLLREELDTNTVRQAVLKLPEGNRKMRRAAMSKKTGRKQNYKRLKKTRTLRSGK